MFAIVHPPSDVQDGNAGSCRALAQYLDKEAGEGLRFFSHTEQNISVEQVIASIDTNKQKLGADDAKFFMLSLNPSEAEQKHLIGRDVSDISELTADERQEVIRKLEIFTRSAMDEYAQNFGRDKIRSGADLMYFARVETERIYKHTDEAVKDGMAKIGDVKPGLQFHVHIIVSRKSLDGKTKLSPQVKSTGNEWELEGRGTVKRGFSHINWKVRVQQAFNESFSYQSKEAETYQIKQPPQQEKIVASIPDKTLRDLLMNYQFTAANQIVFAMREQGYEHLVRHGVHTFSRDGGTFQISHSELKQFERPLSEEQLEDIAKRFDLAKYENGNGNYNENGLQVKEVSFFTYQMDESGQKYLKDVSYKVIVDEQTKMVVSFATVRQFAFAHQINLMKSDLDKEVVLRKMKNADLKDLLSNYRFTAGNQIVVAMKERGYEHRVRKGVHTFKHPVHGTVSIRHKDLVNFQEKIDDATMQDIAERFNLYKFKKDFAEGSYNENGLSAKTIEFNTYVKVPIKPEGGENQESEPDNTTQEKQSALGENEDDKVKYRKELKSVSYDVIYDDKTHVTIPVSLLKHFAYKYDISLMDRFKHSYAVENEDMRECLRNPELKNVRQINKEMRSRGYRVEMDEEGRYTYTRGDTSFKMERRDLRAFTNYAKNTKEKDTFADNTGRAASMIGGSIQNKIMNEILGDNFRTERMVIGKVKTAVSLVQNPANIKMMLVRKIAGFLNPFKEL